MACTMPSVSSVGWTRMARDPPADPRRVMQPRFRHSSLAPARAPSWRFGSSILLFLVIAPPAALGQGVPQAAPSAKPPATYPIIAATTPHGRITPTGMVMVTSTDSAEFVIEPDEGYHVARLLVDGRKAQAAQRYVFRGVRSRRAIAAEFELNAYRISTEAGPNGSILPTRPPATPHGGRARFDLTPKPGYHLDSLYVDGVPVRPRDVLQLEGVTSSRVVTARFAQNEYLIVASAGPHATISPSGVIPVKHGESLTFTFRADPGYTVRELLIDGKSVGVGPSYTLSRVSDHHRLVARISRPVADILSPQDGEVWVEGETREIHWQPADGALGDTGEVRVSVHGANGPWMTIWRGPLRVGSAEWKVASGPTDSLMVCVVSLGRGAAQGLDFAPGLVRVQSSPYSASGTRFYVRAAQSPVVRGPVRFEVGVPGGGEAALEIYSVNGRQVYRKPLENHRARETSWTWDGQVAGGGLAEPGVYFVRLVTGLGTRQCRLVIVR